MGTRATVKFYEREATQPISSVYHQFDGYITGVGHDLAKWLKTKKLTDGYSTEQKESNQYANGMGCLAAQYVAEFKNGIGNFYITYADDLQEYNYEVRERLLEDDYEITMNNEVVGTPDDLLKIKNLTGV